MLTKVYIVQAMDIWVFSNRHVWVWEVDHKEDWVLKKWCFWTRVSWAARRSNQSILKEINPEYSLEGLMLKLKLQYFGPPDVKSQLQKRPWCWERSKAGGEGDGRGWAVSTTDSMDTSLSKLQEVVKDREAWCATDHGVVKSWTRLNDWTPTISATVDGSWPS